MWPEAIIRATTMAKEAWRTRGPVAALDAGRRPDQYTHSWRKPSNNIIKVNYDATWVAAIEKGGIRVVAWDWEGIIIDGRNTT